MNTLTDGAGVKRPVTSTEVNTTNEVPAPLWPKEITLSNGARCLIQKGKGKHAMEATKICKGDQSKFMPALMAQLVTIGGKKIFMEDLAEMDLEDYLSISAEFGENFTSPATI